MIDPDRILALAQEPPHAGVSRGRDADRAKMLGGLGNTTSPMATPVAWSAARCTSDLYRADRDSADDRRSRAGVCGGCPIRHACFTAHLAGAPQGVREWRARVAGAFTST